MKRLNNRINSDLRRDAAQSGYAEPSGRIRSVQFDKLNTALNASPSIESRQTLAHSLFDQLANYNKG